MLKFELECDDSKTCGKGHQKKTIYWGLRTLALMIISKIISATETTDNFS